MSLLDFPQSSYVIFPFWFLASSSSTIPLAFFLSVPSGLSAKLLIPLLSKTLFKVSNGVSTVEGNPREAIVLLTAVYMTSVYFISAGMSIYGQLLGNKAGYKNKEPRLNKRNLPSGLPHRMVSTHEALYDIFPAYGVTAALLAVSMSPNSTLLPINALALHVFLRLAVYWPAYLLNLDSACGASSLGHHSYVLNFSRVEFRAVPAAFSGFWFRRAEVHRRQSKANPGSIRIVLYRNFVGTAIGKLAKWRKVNIVQTPLTA
ncbi:hypothetical protein FB451DRAFT_1170593 [Mycena latifolia]|nr:hypothetical protein FB451DRAFT_1170593 [Mycena latifolia]